MPSSRPRPPARRPRAGGFTALEVLIAAVLMALLIGGAVAMFSSGSRNMATATLHASIRQDAARVLDRIQRDLDRVVVGDDFDRGQFPSVIAPLRLTDAEKASKLEFYAYHHRRFHGASRRLELVGHRIAYEVLEREDGQGVDLLRNGRIINPSPLSDVTFRYLDAAEAGTLGVSTRHAVTVTLVPRDPGYLGDDRLAKHHPQSRLFHLKNVESQYACLVSLKAAGAPYPILSKVPFPPRRARVYGQYRLDEVPLDWLRPLGLVTIENKDFDDATEHQHEIEVNS